MRGRKWIVIKYVDIEEQVDADFTRARHRASWHRLKSRLRNDRSPRNLLSFEETRKARSAYNKVRLGRRVVPVERIVGSVGRYGEFDRTFLPAKASVETKWKRIDRAFHRGQELPPVMLYTIGEAYFVEDGNHRVSVARYRGVEWIDAEVTELYLRVPAALAGTKRGDRRWSSLPRRVELGQERSAAA
jgi:hypothetical protein